MKKSCIYTAIFCLIFSFASNANAEAWSYVASLISPSNEICKEFQIHLENYFSYKRVKESGLIKTPTVDSNSTAFELPNGKSLTPLISDFDNDGKLDAILHWSDGNSYLTGTILYVVPNIKDRKLSSPKLSFEEINVFPCQFDKTNPKSADCPTFSQNADEAGIEFSLGENVKFRGRYTGIEVLNYKNETYLQIHQTYMNKKSFAGIIKPISKTNFESICLFSVEQLNNEHPQ